jgi:hypothetical protein
MQRGCSRTGLLSCLMLASLLGASQSFAVVCLPNTEPVRASVTLPLAQSFEGSALVIRNEAITLRVPQAELLEVVHGWSGAMPSPLDLAVRNILPTSQDISLGVFLERLGPKEPDHPIATRSDAWRAYLRETRALKSRIAYAVSLLLDRARVVGQDPAGAPVHSIVRAEEGSCTSRKVYRTTDGQMVLALEEEVAA